MPVFQEVLFPAGFRARLLFALLNFQPCMPHTPILSYLITAATTSAK